MSDQTRTRQETRTQRRTWNSSSWKETMAVVVALLLMLAIAFLLPGAVSQAYGAHAAAGVSLGSQLSASSVSAANVTTTTVTSTEEITATGEVTAPVVLNWKLITLSGKCKGCISGYVIDRFHNLISGAWPLVLTTPDGKQFAIPIVAGQFRIPATGTGLCPGTYKLKLQVPAGYKEITPSSIEVPLDGTENGCVEVRFKVDKLPVQKIIKVDTTGTGLPDWHFSATTTGGLFVDCGKTNAFGELDCALPQWDTWNFIEDVQNGWVPVPPGSDVQTKALAPVPGPLPPLIFTNKEVHTGDLLVCKTDTAGNPTGGVNIQVDRIDGTRLPVIQATALYPPKVGPEQCTLFQSLALGDYMVTPLPPPLSYTPDVPVKVTLDQAGMIKRVDFSDAPLGCIKGQKVDYNYAGLQGWVITATNDVSGQQLVAVTNTAGWFEIDKLPMGAYTVEEKMKPGWHAVTSSVLHVAVTKPYHDCAEIRFKNMRDSACLEVIKKDTGDPTNPGIGIAGVPIYVKPVAGTAFPAVLTNGLGKVVFDNLTPGIYDVCEVVPPGWLSVPTAGLPVCTAGGVCCYPALELVPTEPCWAKGWGGPVIFNNRQTTDEQPPADDPPPSP